MIAFQGVVAATITPFTERDELDENALRRVLEWNIDAGVNGFWLCGGTGESVLLTVPEVVRTAEVAAAVARGRVATIVHVGALTTRAAIKMAGAVARSGADAVCCVPPFFYSVPEHAIVSHFRAVADAADLPFFIYNQPKYTGVEFTPKLMETLVRTIPQLKGIKHSALTFENIARFAEMGLAVFTGHGQLMVPALAAGAAGVIDGPITVAPEIWVRAYQAFREGDLKRAREFQLPASELVALVQRYGFIAACKALTGERIDVECGDPRLPIPPLSTEERRELVAAARDMGILTKVTPTGRTVAY